MACVARGQNGLRRDAPGSFEHLRQHQHRHVASQPVAPGRQLPEHADQRLLQGRAAVVQLEGVGPAVEVRVASVGEDAAAVHAAVVARLLRQLLRRAADVVLGVLVHPRVIGCRVIRDEVENQPETAIPEPLPKPTERGIAAEVVVHAVVLHGETRAAHVVRLEVGEEPRILLQPVDVRRGHPPALRACLPDPEEPDQVEPRLRPLVQLTIRHVIERRRTPEPRCQLRQIHPGVHLEQGRILLGGPYSVRVQRCEGAKCKGCTGARCRRCRCKVHQCTAHAPVHPCTLAL